MLPNSHTFDSSAGRARVLWVLALANACAHPIDSLHLDGGSVHTELARTDEDVSCRASSVAAPGSIDFARSTIGMPDPRLAGITVTGAAPDADGRVYIYGSVTDCVGSARGNHAAVVRLAANGQIDPTFGEKGRICVARSTRSGNPVDMFQAMTHDASGRIVLVGYSLVEASVAGLLLRLDTNGQRDETFGPEGVRVLSGPGVRFASMGFYDVSADEDGIVLVGSDGHPFQWSASGIVLRLRNDGELDPAFNRGAIRVDTDAAVYSAVVRVQDGYVLAGWNLDGVHARVLRLDRAGRPASDFGVGGIAMHSARGLYVRGLTVTVDGGFIVGGALDRGVAWEFGLQRFDHAGRPDRRFGVDGTLGGSLAWDTTLLLRSVMAADRDGRVLVALQDGSSVAVARVLPHGAFDLTFGECGVRRLGNTGAARAVFVDPRDGTIVVVGVLSGGGLRGDAVGLWRLFP